MLAYYAEQGDVQMAVSVLIVLGDRIRKDIDELTQVCCLFAAMHLCVHNHCLSAGLCGCVRARACVRRSVYL